MRKQIEVEGPAGKFYGVISVTAKIQNKMVHNSSLHEDEPKTVKTWEINLGIDGRPFGEPITGLISEEAVLRQVKISETYLINQLNRLANQEFSPTFEDKLKGLGFAY